MTVESNYMIGIATLSDWLENLAPVIQPKRSKTLVRAIFSAV